MSELEQAKQSLTEEQLKVQESQRQIDKQRELLSNPNQLRKAGLGYLLSPAYKRQKMESVSQLNLAQENVSTRKEELKQFEKNIKDYEDQEKFNQEQQKLYDQQKAEYDRQQAEQQRQINDYNFGRKLAMSGKGALGLTSKEARQGYIDARENLNAVSQYKVQLKEQEALKKLDLKQLPLISAYSPPMSSIKSSQIQFMTPAPKFQGYNLPPNLGGLKGTEQSGTIIDKQKDIFFRLNPLKPVSVVSKFELPPRFYPQGTPTIQEIKETKGFLNKIIKASDYIPDPFPRYYTQKGIFKEKYLEENTLSKKIPEGATGVVGFGAGLVSGGIALGIEYPLYLVRHPIQTIKSTFSLPKSLLYGDLGKTIGQEFAMRPAYATGFAFALARPGFKPTISAIDITLPKIKIVPEIIISRDAPSLGKVPSFGEVLQASSFTKKPKTEVPSPQIISAVEKGLGGSSSARRRATVLLKDQEGNYILDASGGESGLTISYGGGINLKESPRLAAIRELREESGLNINRLKYEGKQVFPEESQYIYSTTLTPEQISQLKNIRLVSPSEAKGVLGQSAKYPFSKDGIRVYELAVINWLESGKKTQPQWLYSETPQGKFYYGTQARYNIDSGAIQSYKSFEDPLLLGHGTSSIKSQLIFKKDFVVRQAERAEEGAGLYVHPPISTKVLGEVKKLIGYSGEGEFLPTKQFKQLPFKVPDQKAPGYIGLSYVFGGTGEGYTSTLGFSLPFKKRGAFLFDEILGKDIRATKKAIMGTENELAYEIGVKVRTSGKRKVEYISGKRISLQPAKIVRMEKVNQAIGNYKPFGYGKYKELPTTSVFTLTKSGFREVKPRREDYKIRIEKERLRYGEYLERLREPRKNIYSYREPFGEIRGTEPEFLEPKNLEPKGYGGYVEKYSEIPKGYNGIYNEPPKFPPIYQTPRNKDKEEKKRRRKQALAYSILIKRRGKYVPFRTGLTRGRALQLASSNVERELSRQFKIVQSGTTESQDIFFKPNENLFRDYRVVKGKRVALAPGQFIQRTKSLLQSPEEKELIRQSRMFARI